MVYAGELRQLNIGHTAQLKGYRIFSVVANLSPLSEKSGLKLARAAGPYLVTLLSSGSHDIRSASAVALGNLALAGYKVVKVLVNQDVVERLTQSVEEQDHSSSYIQG